MCHVVASVLAAKTQLLNTHFRIDSSFVAKGWIFEIGTCENSIEINDSVFYIISYITLQNIRSQQHCRYHVYCSTRMTIVQLSDQMERETVC